MVFDKQVWALVASVLQLVAGLGHLGLTWRTNDVLRDLFWPLLIPLLVTSTGEWVSLYYSYMTDEASALPDVALAIAIVWIMYMEERLQFSLFDLVSNYRYVALPIFGVGLLLMIAYVICLILEITSLSPRSYKEYFLAVGCIVHRGFIVLPLAMHICSNKFLKNRQNRPPTNRLLVCLVIALILTAAIAFVPWFYPYDPRNNQCLYLYLFFLVIAILYLTRMGWKRCIQPKQGVPPANSAVEGEADSASTRNLVGPGNGSDPELGREKQEFGLTTNAVQHCRELNM